MSGEEQIVEATDHVTRMGDDGMVHCSCGRAWWPHDPGRNGDDYTCAASVPSPPEMQRAGGAPGEQDVLGEFDAENGTGASEELLSLAVENTHLMRGGSKMTPGEKLESWRFVVAETDTDEKRLKGLLGWMREVEDQLDALRDRLPDNVTELHGV